MDKQVDQLYGIPLDEFTAERDRLAKRLRSEGRPEDAAVVKALKKPTLPAWAVNQLSRRHRKDLRRLLEAGQALRKAHAGVGARGGRERLRAATDREREIVASLVDRAAAFLSEGGQPSPANLERVRNTLHAAAADEELRDELAAGRVVKDRESVGLGPLGLGPAPAPAKRAGSRRLSEARSAVKEATKRLRAAEAALERTRADAEAAQRALEDRRRSVEAARREAEETEEALRAAERDAR